MKTLACRYAVLFLASFLTLAFTVSCATTPDKESKASQIKKEKMKRAKKRVRPPQSPKLAQSPELLMSQPDLIPKSSNEKPARLNALSLRGPRISLVSQEADIRTVLLAISKEVRQQHGFFDHKK